MVENYYREPGWNAWNSEEKTFGEYIEAQKIKERKWNEDRERHRREIEESQRQQRRKRNPDLSTFLFSALTWFWICFIVYNFIHPGNIKLRSQQFTIVFSIGLFIIFCIYITTYLTRKYRK